MEELEIIDIIRKVFFVKGNVNKYQLLKILKKTHQSRNYDKIDEIIKMGFISRTSDIQSPTFVVDNHCKKRIWEFLKNTEFGFDFIKIEKEFVARFE